MTEPALDLWARHRRATARRLHRVHRALSAWDEYEATQALPPELRRPVQASVLERATLKELQGMRIDRPRELELLAVEARGARRN